MKMNKRCKTWRCDHPTCPWCGYEHDIADGDFYDQNEVGHECWSCEREFTCIGDVSWSFSTYKVEEEK